MRLSVDQVVAYCKRTNHMEKIAPRNEPKPEKMAKREEPKKEYLVVEGTQCWGESIIIEVPGRAVPAVRMTTKGKYVKEAAQRYLSYKEQIGYYAKFKIAAPSIKYVIVDVKIYLHGKNTLMGLDPDVDNLLKSAMDGLKGVAYIDDRQVAKASVAKFPCKHEINQKMVIEIKEM